tara:strand:+ start:325 stop:507 length:183 start_codon:yes stop_codon:yes gene_type:complete
MENLDTKTCWILLNNMKWKKQDALSKCYDSDETWDYYKGWHDAIEELQEQILKGKGDQND